jgi:DNA-binding NtrC family response regulator
LRAHFLFILPTFTLHEDRLRFLSLCPVPLIEPQAEKQLHAQSITPDALIVDDRLADAMSGVQIIERLRAVFGKPLPALIITGTANPAHLESRAGGIPFAIKPVAPGRLRAFLSQALRQA